MSMKIVLLAERSLLLPATIFIADMASGGGSATLNNAVLTFMTMPEPQT